LFHFAWRNAAPKLDKCPSLFLAKKAGVNKFNGLPSWFKEQKHPWEQTQHQQEATGLQLEL
jgi:hypothetical protein